MGVLNPNKAVTSQLSLLLTYNAEAVGDDKLAKLVIQIPGKLIEQSL